MATLEHEQVLCGRAAHVFAAATGRRARVLRMTGIAAGVLAVGWLAALGLALFGAGAFPGALPGIKTHGPASAPSHPVRSTPVRGAARVPGFPAAGASSGIRRAPPARTTAVSARRPVAPVAAAAPAAPAQASAPSGQGWARRGWTAPPGQTRRGRASRLAGRAAGPPDRAHLRRRSRPALDPAHRGRAAAPPRPGDVLRDREQSGAPPSPRSLAIPARLRARQPHLPARRPREPAFLGAESPDRAHGKRAPGSSGCGQSTRPASLLVRACRGHRRSGARARRSRLARLRDRPHGLRRRGLAPAGGRSNRPGGDPRRTHRRDRPPARRRRRPLADARRGRAARSQTASNAPFARSPRATTRITR